MMETLSPGMTDNNRTLPEGWTFADLGDLLDIVRGISFPSSVKKFEPEDGYIACLRTTNVQRDVEWDNLWFVPEEYLKRDEQLIQSLDILISTANSYELVGKVAQVQQMPVMATLGAFISLIRVPIQLDAKYFYFLLSSREAQERIRKLASTTTNISNVSTKKLKTLTLQVPPLNEQRRIVEKIEELFAKLDAGVRSLEQVRAQLKSYRRSVLKAAVEGELSRVWREAHKDEIEPASELLERILQERRERFAGKKYKEPAAPDTSELPGLPDGWQWASADQLTTTITDGEHITPERSASGVPLLSARNIQDGWLSFEKVDYIPESVFEVLARRLLIKPGDVLMSCSGTVGRSCVAPENSKFALVRSVAVLKPLAEMGKFLSYSLRSSLMQEQIHRKKTQTAQANIFQGKIRTLVFALPSLEEQRFIVDEVERRLSVVNTLEATVEANLKQAGGLRQSILKQAFSGKLVPQDPDDEPASVLLARIREERQAAKQKASKRRRPKTGRTKHQHAEQEGLF